MARRRNRLFLSTLLLCLCLSFAQVALAQDAVSDLLGRINGLRASVGQPGYSLNAALSAAANAHAQWMASTGQVSHVQPDGSSPRDRARAAGYTSPWVSENIYIGTQATTGAAWNFWVNSAIHYAGLTSPNYSEVGIGTASGSGGRAYVLVFGNPSPPSVSTSRGSSGNSNSAAAPQPPSFVVGLDSQGNIMHEIQPGDTMGDIALIYGYTWSDLPYMLELNDLTWDDVRVLKVGSIFLVPPYDGTYTPTPETASLATAPAETPAAESTEESQPSVEVASVDLSGAAAMPTPSPSPAFSPAPLMTQLLTPVVRSVQVTPTSSATTSGLMVRTLPPATSVAMLPTLQPVVEVAPPSDSEDGPPLWLIFALVAQLGILGYALWEYLRRR